MGDAADSGVWPADGEAAIADIVEKERSIYSD
jgi:hypothetical protein